jgi:hypothetical protein
MSGNTSNEDSLVFIDPQSGFDIRSWPASLDAEAAAILADSTGEGSSEAGQRAIDEARSGRRPLVAETDEEGLGFYKACGFKMVGRRKHPSGAVRYRIGWHAPGLRFKGGSTNSLTHKPVKDQ